MHSPPTNTHLDRRAGLLVFATALATQSWMLSMPFQFDDYALIADPWKLFALAPDDGSSELPFMLRWTLWAFWGIGWTLSNLFSDVLSPLPFHALGLLGHATVSLLLAKLVSRLCPQSYGQLAGTITGVAFALCAGGIPAASWIAAQSDLLFPLFGLASAHAFLNAREAPETQRTKTLILAGFLTWLTLVSKAPALLQVLAIAAMLFVHAPSDPLRRNKLRMQELATLALATLAAFACRWFYLGSFKLRYGSTEPPSLTELPSLLPKALDTISQALLPWNRHPLFSDRAPFLSGILPASWSVTHMALALTLPTLLLAFALCKNARKQILFAGAIAVIFALPATLLAHSYTGNVNARNAYPALVPTLAALGIACAALISAPNRKPIGIAATVVLLFQLSDGWVHVSGNWKLASLEHARSLAAIESVELERQKSAPYQEAIYAVLNPARSYGGIPLLGYRITAALSPPFRTDPLPVISFETEAQRIDHLATDPDAGQKALCSFAPHQDFLSSSGAEARKHFTLRPQSPLRPGLGSTSPTWQQSGLTWTASQPIPAHAIPWAEIELDLGPAQALQLELQFNDGTATTIPLLARSSTSPRRLHFRPWVRAEQWWGPAVTSYRLNVASRPTAFPLAAHQVPALKLTAPPGGSNLDFSSTQAPTVTTAAPLPAAAHFRIEWQLELPAIQSFSIFADLPAPDGPGQLQPTQFHVDPRLIPGSPSNSAPWPQFITALAGAFPCLRPGSAYQAPARWRVLATHPSGHLAAESPWTQGTFTGP